MGDYIIPLLHSQNFCVLLLQDENSILSMRLYVYDDDVWERERGQLSRIMAERKEAEGINLHRAKVRTLSRLVIYTGSLFLSPIYARVCVCVSSHSALQ